jgi:hypothetical protein
VVDVEGEPHLDSAALRGEETVGDELRRLLLEVEVVEREVERRFRAREEAGGVLGDLARGLTPVAERAKLDVRRSREP